MSKIKKATEPELLSTVHRSIVSIPVSDIQVAEGRRPLTEENLKTLADSIATIGLQTPILVIAAPEGAAQAYRLVAGHHRLEACRRLGHHRIEAIVLDDRSPDDAELNEIAENLHREDLPPAEKARLLVRWAELQTQKVGQVAPLKRGRGQRGGDRATSEAAGIERTKLRRAHKLQSLTPEAMVVAEEVGLSHNQNVLLKAATFVGADEQIRSLRNEANRRAEARKIKSSSQVRKEPSDPRAAWLDEGAAWWDRGEPAWREEFALKVKGNATSGEAPSTTPAALKQDVEDVELPPELDRRGERG